MALKTISKELVEFVNTPLDAALIRKNYGGEKYITGYTVVRLLNKMTNGAWDFTIDKVWKESCKDKKGEHDVYHMNLTLRCVFDDGNGNQVELMKTGTAGKVLESGAKNATNIYKSLETLALRKAASYFGIGAELWLNDDEVDYFEQEDTDPVWTEELVEKHKTEWNAVEEIQKSFGLSDEEIDAIVYEWNPIYDSIWMVSPDDLAKFVDFLEKESESFSEETNNG